MADVATGVRRLGGGALALVGTLLLSLALSAPPADARFGGDGTAIFHFRGSVERVVSHRGGTLLLGGFSGEPGILRLRRDGSIDRSFGRRGVVRIAWADVRVTRPGRILVIGSPSGSGEPFARNARVTKLHPNGRRFRGFGRGGSLQVDLGGLYDTGTAIAMGGRGRILIGGSATDEVNTRDGGPSNPVAVVARLTPRGKLDRRFSGDGRALIREGFSVLDVAGRGDGEILAMTAGFPETGVVALRRGGERDRGFGGSGFLSVAGRAEPGYPYFIPVPEIGVLRGGGLIVVGTLQGLEGLPFESGNDLMAKRFTSTGRPDPDYGSGGEAWLRLSRPFSVAAFAVRRDGGIVTAGGSPIIPDIEQARFIVASLGPDGSFDSRFGRGGAYVFDFPGADGATGVAVQGRRALVVGAAHRAEGWPRTILRRLPLVHRSFR